MPGVPIEIEYKFPVLSVAKIRQLLVKMGARSINTSLQVDEYLNDPIRDFSKMDLALRIRQSDDSFFLTFKGPGQDAVAKIRREIETPLVDAAAAAQLKQTFIGIGLYSVAVVEKKRESLSIVWKGHEVEVCLDSVVEVGEFVELELIVETPSQKDAAKAVLNSLAKELGLSGAIRTSYLELLLRKRGDIPS